jgi:chromosome transmission fidelity protein 1
MSVLYKPTLNKTFLYLLGNVVIIDEAHNLLETINNVYSTEITGAHILRTHSQLQQYEVRFRSRLKAKNLLYIKQIIYILSCFVKCLGGSTSVSAEQQSTGSQDDTKLWTIHNFLFHTKLDNYNMFKVVQYCRNSQISKKLNGFVEKYPAALVKIEKENKIEETSRSGVSAFLKDIANQKPSIAASRSEKESSSSVEGADSSSGENTVVLRSPLVLIESFLQSLTNENKDGRIVVNKKGLLSASSIKFLLLNPAVHFSAVVRDARAVLLAGGTMQPVAEFKDQLFQAVGVPPERILEYSCGHVIPPDNLLAMSVCAGPTGVDLDFTYQARSDPKLLCELGRLLCNVCNIVPGGVVCFLPSYDYEQLVYAHFQTTGVLQRIGAKKKVFREPRKAGQVSSINVNGHGYKCWKTMVGAT